MWIARSGLSFVAWTHPRVLPGQRRTGVPGPVTRGCCQVNGGLACRGRDVPKLGAASRHPDEVRRTRPATRRRLGVIVVSWFVLVVSGLLEAVWATALGKSEGLSRLGPTIVFAAALILSMAGLAWAMRTLPVGTSYAVWVGIGATLTVGYAMATGAEAVSVLKILLLLGLISCIVGLKLVH